MVPAPSPTGLQLISKPGVNHSPQLAPAVCGMVCSQTTLPVAEKVPVAFVHVE